MARGLLAPVYASFTEGFAFPDLVEAKALLDELGAAPADGAQRHKEKVRTPQGPDRLGDRIQVTSADSTYVALDGDGRPRPVIRASD